MHGMHGSMAVGRPVADWLLVLLCGLTGVACLLRVHRLRPSARAGGLRAAAAGEAWMGFAMAAMALPSFLGGALSHTLFLALCGVAVVWELALLVRQLARRGSPYGWRAGAHRLHHLLAATAMAYMAYGTAASAGEAVTGTVTGALTAYFAAYALLTGARLLPAPAAAPAPVPAPSVTSTLPAHAGAVDPPGLAAACRVAMATGMVAMLIAM